jgi:hypothetical protein
MADIMAEVTFVTATPSVGSSDKKKCIHVGENSIMHVKKKKKKSVETHV